MSACLRQLYGQLLQSYQHQDHAFVFVQAGHGFTQDRALGFRMIGDFHGIAWNPRGSKQVARLDGSIGSIRLDIDATSESDILASLQNSLLLHLNAGTYPISTADYTRYPRIIRPITQF